MLEIRRRETPVSSETRGSILALQNSLIFFPLAKSQENPGVKCQNLYHILSWREEFLAQNKENLLVNTGSCVISAKDNNQ